MRDGRPAGESGRTHKAQTLPRLVSSSKRSSESDSLVRDRGLLPLRSRSNARILAGMPRLQDLIAADTCSAYPAAGTHLCSYSILEPSCEAVAAVCFGELPAAGRLPVSTA